MEVVLYEGVVSKIIKNSNSDYLHISTTHNLGYDSNIEENKYIELDVIKDKFEVGNHVTLKIVRERNKE